MITENPEVATVHTVVFYSSSLSTTQYMAVLEPVFFSLSHVVNISLSLKVDQDVSFFSTRKNYFHLSTYFPSTGYSKINGVYILHIKEKYI